MLLYIAVGDDVYTPLYPINTSRDQGTGNLFIYFGKKEEWRGKRKCVGQ
jgi:hypothetical protein